MSVPKKKNKHESKKLNAGRGAVGKTAVMGLRERDGRVIAMTVPNTEAVTLQREILTNVKLGSTLHTDESKIYSGIGAVLYTHETVNHSAGEYVRGNVSTNSIESVWAVMKRGLHGVYHHASEKHLNRYVDEFSFRLNDGNVKRHTIKRMNSFIDGVVGRHLAYKELIK